MYPTRVTVSAFDVQPESFALDYSRDVAVKELRYLSRSYVGLTQHRRDGGDGRDTFAQCSGQSILPDLVGASGGSGRFARHDLQSVTPRKLQMMQTKVLQSAHG